MLSFVIPAFNEEENLKETIEEIKALSSQKLISEEIEIIVVDDHSSDNTFQIVKSFKDRGIQSLRLSRRSGSHTALRAGMTRARGNAVVCISADRQDDPTAVQEMEKKWKSGAHIVWALSRRRNEPLIKKWCSILFYKIINWSLKANKNPIDLSRACFFLLDRKVLDAINQCPERNTSLFGLIRWLGFNQDYVEFDRRERKSGKSKWNFSSRLHLAKDWFIAFSGLPLKMMTAIGFIVSSIGFLYAIFIAFYALSGKTIQGWASIMIIILILGGLYMLMLGIIGEYLWRTLDESRHRPLYFIEKNTWEESD